MRRRLEHLILEICPGYQSLKGAHRTGASPDLGKLIEWELGALILPGYLSLKTFIGAVPVPI